MKLKIFIGLCFLFCVSIGYAQKKPPINKSVNKPVNRPDTLTLDAQKDLKSQLMPLDSILAIAVKHSPSVKFQQDLIQTAEAELNYNKKLWTSNVVGFVNYSGGNQNIITAGSTSGGTLNSSNVTTGVRMGVQVNLPLTELVGRKSRLNTFKYQLNSTIDKKAETEQSVKSVVIDLYYNLLFASNVLAIRSEAMETTINQYQIAQKQFKDGIIDIAELSRLKSIEVNARADYEEAKRRFSTYYSQIEPIVGVPVQQLILKK